MAVRLASSLAVPHVEIDALAYDPQRAPVAFEALEACFGSAIESDGWVVEGMHRDQLRSALLVADTFVWVDLTRARVAVNLLRRSVWLLASRRERHGRRVTLSSMVRDEMPFIRKTVRRHGDRKKYGEQFLADAAERGLTVAHLRTPGEVSDFLARRS